MTTLIIDQAGVRRWLPMAECIEVQDAALRSLADGDAVQPLRSATWLPDRSGLLGVMPGHLATGPEGVLGIKVVSVFPGNHGTELDAHQGAVMIFSPSDGRLLAIMDASEITAIRTAAVSAVATRAMARPDASTLAVLGSGTQARTHVEAMRLVRPITHVRIWSPRRERAEALARTIEGCTVEAATSAPDAVREADIVCTTTSAREPVLHGEWLAPGTHVNAVGACLRHCRELDADAVARSRLVVDRRESALAEAGDVIIAIEEGAIGEDHITGELGEVLAGRITARGEADEITLFESQGLAVEDLAAANHIYVRAREAEGTLAVELGGRRHDPA